MAPFDAVLLISFGGPQGPDDIRPFLANVLRGRRVPQSRVDEVAHHYEMFGGVSPLNEITMRVAAGLRERLATTDAPLPVYVGMRNWHPLLADTMIEMSRAGVRRAVGLIMAAHHSYSSCEQYRENVRDARVVLRERGEHDIDVTYLPGWHTDARLIASYARAVERAVAQLPAEVQEDARLIFTAHSIPMQQAERSRYREELHESSAAVARAAGRSDWQLVYQSRSGRPEDPWLEPDILDYLKSAHSAGMRAVVLCPIGFICDHIEVLYDLDFEAANLARSLGLPLTRALTPNDDPLFIEMLTEAVLTTMRRYGTGWPLPLAHLG